MKSIPITSFEEVQKRFEAAAEGMALSWTMHYAAIGFTFLVISLFMQQQPSFGPSWLIFTGLFVFCEAQAYRWAKRAGQIREFSQNHVLTGK